MTFVFEILISFTPYIFLACLINFAISLVLLRHKNLQRIKAVLVILVMIFVLLTLITGLPVINFYFTGGINNLQVDSNIPGKQQSTIKTAFFNKLFSNRNYAQISEGLSVNDPDIVAFAEFMKADADQISYLSNYPYRAFSRSTTFLNETEMAIFSKFPLSEIKQDPVSLLPSLEAKVQLPKADAGNDRDQYIAVDNDADSGGREITFLAVHTAAPVNQRFFVRRGEQLRNLAEYIGQTKTSTQTGNLTTPTIISGDFNLTPWSVDYNNLINNLPEFADAARGRGVQFTWFLVDSILGATIDHTLYSTGCYEGKGIVLRNHAVQGSYGSDHHLILSEFAYGCS